ncbi:MAG: diacylglycerol/polyprenol kinase family protein [Endomicrobiia bacterium]
MDQSNKDFSEIKRKIFHLGTLLYPILYNILPRTTSLIISGSLIFADIIVESIRLVSPKFNEIILKPLKGIYRTNEIKNISTLIWTFTGAFLTMFIFLDKKIVTTALLYMVFGDSAAGLVGIHHGKTKLGYKSLEGSMSCLLICLICGLFFLPWQVALLGALVATIIEFLPLPFSDNFWVPLISGFALTFFKKIFTS